MLPFLQVHYNTYSRFFSTYLTASIHDPVGTFACTVLKRPFDHEKAAVEEPFRKEASKAKENEMKLTKEQREINDARVLAAKERVMAESKERDTKFLNRNNAEWLHVQGG